MSEKIVAVPLSIRLVAHLLDCLLCVALLWPLSFLYSATLMPFISQQLDLPVFASILKFLIVYGVIASATIILWQRLGYTPGQSLQGLRVINAKSSNRLTWQCAALRLFLAILSTLTLVGLLWSLFDKQKRTLHDVITGTKVVYTDEIGSAEQDMKEWLCSTK